MFEYTFFRNALIAVAIISVVCAVIGTYIVTRRMVFISGGITHTCFGGLGLGYFLGIEPALTALLFAIGGAFGAKHLERRTRSDSAIGVMWAVGMALGVLFVFLTPGYVPELSTFLFGNVLTVSTADLWVFGAFCAGVCILYTVAWRLILCVSFDADFARTRRLPVTITETVMTVVVSIAIVLSIRLAGIMLLMSLVTLPQIIAELFTHRYRPLIFLAACVSLAGCVGGLIIAFYIDVPASACIVLLLVLLYAISIPVGRMTRKGMATGKSQLGR